ncbi:MAG: glycosyltransferase family 4 protein, partial [Planctomycetota bacterium]
FHGYKGWRARYYWCHLKSCLRKFLAAHNPDALYSRYQTGERFLGTLARRHHIPWIAELNGSNKLEFGNLDRLNLKASRELKLATGVITQGSGLVRRAHRDFQVPIERIHVVENGVNPELFRPRPRSEVRRALGIREDIPILGYAGTYQRYHDLEVVFRALLLLEEDLPQLQIYCVGSGGRRAYYQELAKKLRIDQRVLFLDSVPQTEVALYLNAFDLGLMTCPGEMMEEVRSFKLREYMACDLPVLASATGFHDDSLLRYTLKVPPEDPRAVADALRNWWVNREAIEEQASQAGAKIRQKCTWLSASREIENIVRHYCVGKVTALPKTRSPASRVATTVS